MRSFIFLSLTIWCDTSAVFLDSHVKMAGFMYDAFTPKDAFRLTPASISFGIFILSVLVWVILSILKKFRTKERAIDRSSTSILEEPLGQNNRKFGGELSEE
jgi:hypothetical protein